MSGRFSFLCPFANCHPAAGNSWKQVRGRNWCTRNQTVEFLKILRVSVITLPVFTRSDIIMSAQCQRTSQFPPSFLKLAGKTSDCQDVSCYSHKRVHSLDPIQKRLAENARKKNNVEAPKTEWKVWGGYG